MNAWKKGVCLLLFILVLALTGLAYGQSIIHQVVKPQTYVTDVSKAEAVRAAYQKALERKRLLKTAMSPAQKKISSDLLQLIDKQYMPENGDQSLLFQQRLLHGNMKLSRSGDGLTVERWVYVYIYWDPKNPDRSFGSFPVEITHQDNLNHYAAAWVRISDLEKLASRREVISLRSVAAPEIRTGSVVTEGDAIHQSERVRSSYLLDGTGVKIGIISDGVDTRSTSQAAGDLPADGSGLTVLSNTVGGDEGTAMLEIVHDIAPGADLYFHDCGNNTIAFNSAIDDLVSAGCSIVCDDIGWITQPFFEDGSIASHVQSILDGDVDFIYCSSAGNAGKRHYQGDYYSLFGGSGHDFSHGQSGTYYLYLNMPPEGNVRIVLEWNDAFGSSGNDYDIDLFFIDSSRVVDWSYEYQDGDDNPLEYIDYTVPDTIPTGDYQIMVDLWTGSGKTLEVYIYPSNGTLVYTNNIVKGDAIFGHPGAVDAVAVGAIAANDPGNDDIESFSSHGPVTISFPTPEVRSKPEVCGIDGVTITGAGGFSNPFYGTSASAPHIAALTALIREQFPDSTREAILNMGANSAVDLGIAGFDSVYGYGRADLWNTFDMYAPHVFTKVKVWLEGPYQSGGSMITDLCSCGEFPTTSPYSEAERSVSTVPTGIVDWILLGLRSTSGGTTIGYQSFFLKSNGMIVDTDGTTEELLLPNADPGNYHILVYHRCHIGVMSLLTQALDQSSPSLYDFTSSLDQYYGTSAKSLETYFGLYAGDANGNGQVQVDDKNDYWWQEVGMAGYKCSDFNLNGQVQVDDKNDYWWQNVGIGTQIP